MNLSLFSFVYIVNNKNKNYELFEKKNNLDDVYLIIIHRKLP